MSTTNAERCYICGDLLQPNQPVVWKNITFGAAGSVPSTMKPHHTSCAYPPQEAPMTAQSGGGLG